MTDRNAENTDKKGISGVVLWRLALNWIYFFEDIWKTGVLFDKIVTARKR